MCHVFRRCSIDDVPFLPFFIGYLGGIAKKVRVIGILDCLDNAGVDISKDNRSSRDSVRVVCRGHPCRIYSKAVVPWLKTEESRLLQLPSIYHIDLKIAPFIGVSFAIVCKGRVFINMIKFKWCD